MDNPTTATLETEIEKLKKTNEFKTDVISISAHELRTSLGAMKWLLKMCIDGDLGGLNDEQTKLLTKAYESNDRMIGLVSEMLSINHTDEGALNYNPEPTDIVALIDSVLFDFVGESYKRGVELLFLKPENALADVHLDKGKMRFVIQNLIDNALKYSSPKGKIIISVHEKDNELGISVKDNGIGILDEDRDKIFQKFFRSKNAKEREEIGSGLGLFSSKTILEHQHGTLLFESAKGQGTTFFITLPL